MISLLVTLIIVAVLLYILNVLLGDVMSPKVKMAINALVCLILFLYILQFFGVWHGMPRL